MKRRNISVRNKMDTFNLSFDTQRITREVLDR